MSWVTTVVVMGRYIPREAQWKLQQGYHEGEDKGGRQVNFGPLADYPIEATDYAKQCQYWNHWGGGKVPEADVLGGAFNHLNVPEMMKWLSEIPWYGEVMVCIMPQEGEQTYRVLGRGSKPSHAEWDFIDTWQPETEPG